MGVTIALDDFGTGYSNLTYLSRLPLDKIKVDRHFTSALLQDDVDASICRSIIFLARSLNLEVVAEGVETDRQRRWLLEEECVSMQGFFFSRPVPIDQLQATPFSLRGDPLSEPLQAVIVRPGAPMRSSHDDLSLG
jgi:EAL domain-containing protein (putative c-di-GMP-specific phosphodiesterase class I)